MWKTWPLNEAHQIIIWWVTTRKSWKVLKTYNFKVLTVFLKHFINDAKTLMQGWEMLCWRGVRKCWRKECFRDIDPREECCHNRWLGTPHSGELPPQPPHLYLSKSLLLTVHILATSTSLG